jgi:hypothetical protein
MRRARQEWRRGARARALLTLSLAEAEVRFARHEAAAAAPPVGAGVRRARATFLGVTAAIAAVLAGGVWSGVPWNGGPPVAQNPMARPADARPVALSYVPGVVLRLVAPAPESLAATPGSLETVTAGEVPPVLLTVSGEWQPPRRWWGDEPLRLRGADGVPTVAPSP